MTRARSCVCRFGLVLFIFLQLAICQGAPRRAPTTYDQRQDGKFNLHTKFEDTFIVIGIPSSLSSSSAGGELSNLLQNGLLSQALEFKHSVTEEGGNEGSNKENVENTEPVGRELTDQPDEHYNNKVKVIAIVRKNIPLDFETSEQLSEPASAEDEKTSKDTPVKLQTQNAELNEATLKITTRSVAEKSEKNPLPENSNTSNSDDLNCVGRKELRLIGDGIENCGPERYRDDEGVCQSCPTASSSSS
ncbi:uncharacterized protein [Venturia canescens]|uniref:uncharacterized protein n=1 Tax=Venturia canescens TaxID=32260 RepID=UPI001C9C60ED|nr:uncharacterized protein LOC122409518 [Venturia canescens]